jgi:sugar lactone lactonase YvrE
VVDQTKTKQIEEIMKHNEQWKRKLQCGLVAAAASLLTLAGALHAQTLRPWYGFGATRVASNAYEGVGTVAADAAGNFYYPAMNGETLEVVKVAPNGSQSVAYSGTVLASALAVDSAGNLYLGNYGRLLKVTPAGAQTTMGSGLGIPESLAVDSAGNVYAADTQNNRVVKITPAGTQTTIVTGSFLESVAVDPAGNIYVAGVALLKVAPDGTQTNLPYEALQVAVDQFGDIFIQEPGPQTTTIMITPNGSTATVDLGHGNAAMSVDGFGNVFMADIASDIYKVSATSASLGNAQICAPGSSSCGWNFSLNYDITASGTLGNTSLLTVGQPNLDFTSQSSSCTGTVTAGSTCTVNFTFAPRVAGLRKGAIEIADSNGNVLSTTLLHGTGVGPQVAYTPVASTFATGFSGPPGVAADEAGNVYVADAENSRVVKIAPSGAQTNVGSGYSVPTGLALDGAGNLYVADGATIWMITPGGVQSVYANVLNSYALAVDGAGNIFVAGAGASEVLELMTNGTQVTIGGGWSHPQGVAVDAAGNLYVADWLNNQVVEVPAGGGNSAVIANVSYPSGVMVDAAGDVFISAPNGITEIPAGGGTPVAVSGSYTSSVAADGLGNLYAVSGATTTVTAFHRAQAPALSFASTTVGSSSSDSPQSVTLQNIGNATLTATGLTVGANFAQVAGSGSPEDCSASISLLPGAACNLSLSFTPTAGGALQSTATLTDDALNGTPSTQSIALSGTGLVLSQSISFASIPNQVQGTSLTLTASASSGLTVSFASLTTSVCTVSGTTMTLANPGTCSIQASQAGNSQYAAAAPVTQSFTVTALASFTITASPSSETVIRGIDAAGFLLTLKSVNGFNGTVKLTCSAGTLGSVCGDLPANVHVNGTAYALTGILFPANTAPGTYTVTFTGVSGSITTTATAKFVVQSHK